MSIIYASKELNYQIHYLNRILESLINGIQLFFFNVEYTDNFERLAITCNIYSILFTIEVLLSFSFTVISVISLFRKGINMKIFNLIYKILYWILYSLILFFTLFILIRYIVDKL